MGNQIDALVDKGRVLARAVVKYRRAAFATAATVAALAGVAVTLYATDKYEASARVYVDTKTVLRPLMAGLTYQPDTDQQVLMLARTLISRPNIERLIDMPELQLGARTDSERSRTIASLMERIKVVSALPGGNLYDIRYRGPSPEYAQRLVQATLGMFVHAGVGSKKQDSADAGRFIEEQIRAYEQKLIHAEDRLKEFKIRNFGVSGVADKDYFARVSALTEGVAKLRTELTSAEQAKQAYRRELALEDPQLPDEQSLRNPAAAPEYELRVQAQRKHLDELLRRYTDAHPDVIDARRIAAQLEAEATARREAEARAAAMVGKTGKAGRAATSPVYQKLRISYAEAEAQVAALRSQLASQRSQLEEVRSLAGRAPQVEAELAQLNRDYDVIRKNYDQMVVRRESALLGVKLDESAQLAEFRIVEPPRVSPKAAFPTRLHLALAAIPLSLLAGAGAAFLLHLARPTFDDAKSLRQFSGRPVLGTISRAALPGQFLKGRAAGLGSAALLGSLFLAQLTWATWIALTPIGG